MRVQHQLPTISSSWRRRSSSWCTTRIRWFADDCRCRCQGQLAKLISTWHLFRIRGVLEMTVCHCQPIVRLSMLFQLGLLPVWSPCSTLLSYLLLRKHLGIICIYCQQGIFLACQWVRQRSAICCQDSMQCHTHQKIFQLIGKQSAEVMQSCRCQDWLMGVQDAYDCKNVEPGMWRLAMPLTRSWCHLCHQPFNVNVTSFHL